MQSQAASPRRRRLPQRPDPRALLLAPRLSRGQLAEILKPYGFRDAERADENLQAMAGEPHTRHQLAGILPDLLAEIAQTADPDQGLNHWERFLAAGVNRASLYDFLGKSPRVLNMLCQAFGSSEALAATMIRDPLQLYWLAEQDILMRSPSRGELEQALRETLTTVTTKELKLEAIRRFRRREMLRIGLRDLLRLVDVSETTQVLSDLAASLIQAALDIVQEDLCSRFGVPMHRDSGRTWKESGFAVIGMGKLGGSELNYSSDIDLIYVCGSEEGKTRPSAVAHGRTARAGAHSITNEEYFEHVARDLTRALAQQTHEGYVYRVDLRLRAEGTVGRLARSVDEYEKYYRSRGQVWERLALLKAWPVAGSKQVGEEFLRAVRPFVLGSAGEGGGRSSALDVVQEVRTVKEMIDRKMWEKGHDRRNVKLGIGGIREIEFLVQTIQVIAGRSLPTVLERGTLGSLRRFEQHGLLPSRAYRPVADAYCFLRDLEHKLQMVLDLQTHALPESPIELERCAIRMGYRGKTRWEATERLLRDYRRHTSIVRKAFTGFFDAPTRSPLFRAVLRVVAGSGCPLGPNENGPLE